jgi:hypothetical protein
MMSTPILFAAAMALTGLLASCGGGGNSDVTPAAGTRIAGVYSVQGPTTAIVYVDGWGNMIAVALDSATSSTLSFGGRIARAGGGRTWDGSWTLPATVWVNRFAGSASTTSTPSTITGAFTGPSLSFASPALATEFPRTIVASLADAGKAAASLPAAVGRYVGYSLGVRPLASPGASVVSAGVPATIGPAISIGIGTSVNTGATSSDRLNIVSTTPIASIVGTTTGVIPTAVFEIHTDLTVAADGHIAGQFAPGCNLDGTMSVADPRGTVYTITGSLTGPGCPAGLAGARVILGTIDAQQNVLSLFLYTTLDDGSLFTAWPSTGQ